MLRKNPSELFGQTNPIAVKSFWSTNSLSLTLKGKKVLIVDDVISTGGSLYALETLVNEAGGEIAGKCAVLAEGDAITSDDIFFLQELPVFVK